jgi:hypothetical protein
VSADLVVRRGQVVIPVHCRHCGERTVRVQNLGGSAPEFCDRRCARAAKHARQRKGITGEPKPLAPLRPCIGCGDVAVLSSRRGFPVCATCRGRLNACLRKKVMATETDARSLASFDPAMTVYRCPLCLNWHMTSGQRSGPVDTDRDLGEQLRAAGFGRDDFMTREDVAA